MSESLKTQAIAGVSWSAVERFSSQGIQFLVQLILARLLCPDDYGVIGMLAIFLSIAQVLVDSGFPNALIQKEHPTEDDYTVVFYYNIGISIALYVILYLIAPFISTFYGVKELIPILRFLSLTIVFNALFVLQKTILVIKVDFRTQSIISLVCIISSGGIGIILAYLDYGVWALCWQQVTNSFLQMLLYSIIVKWKPLFKFDYLSFKKLFSFGSKLMITSIISAVYRNLYSIVIGKKFTSSDLGCYTRAEQFAVIPSTNIGTLVTRVMFPIFSKVQDDDSRLNHLYSLVIKYSSHIIFPLMVGVIAVSKPMVLVILTEKWSGVIPLLQIMCIDYMFDHLSLINLNLLYVKGRSDLVLRLEIIKKPIAILLLFAAIPFGIVGICWSRVIYSVIATFINMYYTHKLVGLSVLKQMIDFSSPFFLSVLMGVFVFFITVIIKNIYLSLLLGVILGVSFYLLTALMFVRKDCDEVLKFYKEYKSK